MALFHTLSMSVPVAQEEMRVSQGKVCETQMHSPFHALLPDLLSPPHQNYKTNTLFNKMSRERLQKFQTTTQKWKLNKIY